MTNGSQRYGVWLDGKLTAVYSKDWLALLYSLTRRGSHVSPIWR